VQSLQHRDGSRCRGHGSSHENRWQVVERRRCSIAGEVRNVPDMHEQAVNCRVPVRRWCSGGRCVQVAGRRAEQKEII